MSFTRPDSKETPLESQYEVQKQAEQQSEGADNSWGSYYQGFFKSAPKKTKDELTYKERHAVRHLRHKRDEEYNKLAFKLCDDFTNNYATCVSGNELSAAWACRRPLQELKACVNRKLISFRENEGEIDSLPVAPNEHVDYDQILNEYYAQAPAQTQTP